MAPKNKTKPITEMFGSSTRGRTDAEHHSITAFIGATDEIAIAMERKWGVDRLPRLVPTDIGARFYSQAQKFNAAIQNGSVADVQVESERMRSAWTYLDQVATGAGAEIIKGDVWEVSIGDGKVVAFVRDWHEGRALLATGRRMDVYTAEEVARIIAGIPTLAAVKEHFPGAELVEVRTPYNWKAGDAIPFGD